MPNPTQLITDKLGAAGELLDTPLDELNVYEQLSRIANVHGSANPAGFDAMPTNGAEISEFVNDAGQTVETWETTAGDVVTKTTTSETSYTTEVVDARVG